jgi:hypothetical protein
MDTNYKRSLQPMIYLSVDRVAGDNIRNFPIELARSRGAYLLHFFSICAVAGYGWNVDLRVHASAPLIFLFFISARCTIVLQLLSTLMIDISPRKSGAAAASGQRPWKGLGIHTNWSCRLDQWYTCCVVVARIWVEVEIAKRRQ